MESITVKPNDTLVKIAIRFRISLVDLLKANPAIKNPDRIFPGQTIYVPVPARHAAEGGSAPPPDPTKDPKYLENVVVAVGLPIWGGPFYLYRNVIGGRGSNAIVLPRGETSLDHDPLKAQSFELQSIYKSKSEAEAAAAAYKMPGSYSYYSTQDGVILPTIVSDTTAPRLSKALRQAVTDEKADAKAASNLAVNLLLWYVGARLPVVAGETGGAAPAAGGAAADATLAGFNAVERGVIAEVRTMMKAPEISKIREAYAAGKGVVVKIGGRTIQYEPGLKASGMTMFGENGFLIGQEAFTSETEFVKTLLHETYRLTTSISQSSGVSAATAAMETKAAFTFAENACKAVMAGF
jgi:LysM repeat protein